MRSTVAVTPPLLTAKISLHVSLLLLVGSLEVRSEDEPNDAKQRTIRRSFTRKILCVYKSLGLNPRAWPPLVDGRDRHTPPGNRTIVPLPVVAAIICQISKSVLVFVQARVEQITPRYRLRKFVPAQHQNLYFTCGRRSRAGSSKSLIGGSQGPCQRPHV